MVADDAGAPGKAVADWLSVWSAELKRVQELTFAARRELLRRLGVEVTVAKAGSGLPRYEIALNLPLDIWETLRRDPEGTSCLGRRRTRGTTSGGSACTSGLTLFRIRHIAAIQPAVPHLVCPFQDLVQHGPDGGCAGPVMT
jgi:hypothetical protein